LVRANGLLYIVNAISPKIATRSALRSGTILLSSHPIFFVHRMNVAANIAMMRYSAEIFRPVRLLLSTL